jgi:hypothetical protein
MAKYVAIFSDLIGDIELNGFSLMTDKEYQNFEELAASITWGFSYEVGDSGEELEYTSGEDFLSRMDFKEISNEEFKALKKTFPTNFGFFIEEAFLEMIVGETDEPEEELDEEDED